MDVLLASLSGIIPFALYFAAAIAMLLIFMKIYMIMTPHDEMALIKENNVAASLVLSGAFLGFSLPLASAAANSLSIVDFIVWGIIACIRAADRLPDLPPLLSQDHQPDRKRRDGDQHQACHHLRDGRSAQRRLHHLLTDHSLEEPRFRSDL